MFSSRLNISEIDGSPSVWPYKLLVSNGSLTDNGDGTATLSAGGGSVGTIAQTQQFTTNANDATTSSTFASSSLTKAITPTSATSKIRVSASFAFTVTDVNSYGLATVFRDSTNLAGGTDGFATVYGPTEPAGISITASLVYLDSPATTSAITYTVKMRNTNGTTTINIGNNGRIVGIILLEELTQ